MRQVLIRVVLLVVFGVAPAFADSGRAEGPVPLSTIPVHIRLQSPIYANSIATHPYRTTVTTAPGALCSLTIKLAHTNNVQGIVIWPDTSSHPGHYANLTANAHGIGVWSAENTYPGTYTATVNCRLGSAAGTAQANFNATCLIGLRAQETYQTITTGTGRYPCSQ